MRISVSADELTGVAGELVDELERRGHETLLHGVLAHGERADWAWASEAVALDLLAGRAEQGIVCGGSDEHEAVVCQLALGESCFWVADESTAHENFSPPSLGGATTRMLLVVAEPEETLARALSSGAKEVRAVSDEHGWRLGRIEDPFGHHWEIGRPLAGWPPGGDHRH